MPSLPPAAQRPPVPANERFQAHSAHLIGRDTEAIFTYFYRAQLWDEPDGESPPTLILRREVPRLLRRYGTTTLLDLPCGDFHWLSGADLTGIQYIGADIVPELVDRNAGRHAAPGRRFTRLNLTTDPLPRATVVLCRDCLVYLRYEQIFRAFANLRRSGSTYLLTTTFCELDANAEIDTGDWRPLNLTLPPFALPPPLATILEGCSGDYADKALALWRIADLPEHPRAGR
jgi:hypothetical protein